MSTAAAPLSDKKIGLALSGGGFRASIFHLGVIWRLEELGLMERISVISAVSGGSILAAYYACEMEEELRKLKPHQWYERDDRIKAFKAVAARFLKQVRLNMRSRALVFAPFYYPGLFIKAVLLRPFRKHAFAALIQAEYDRHLYRDCTLDQLPAVTPGSPQLKGNKCLPDDGGPILTGPKLLLNTTSLMTGDRKAFSRDSNTYLAQLKTSNKNVLKLSQVVGASAGVPVLFPPTAICGELLVDGGVSDNQGIEGLMRPLLEERGGPDCPPSADFSPVDVLLISDASGQLELRHTLSTGALEVYSRVNEILMYQVRGKLLDRVGAAYKDGQISFAFVHLLLNLKDDARIKHRVSSEFLEPLGRIRTDLDQFSFVEAEALMYHGYTLIDAMVRRWCCGLMEGPIPPMLTPPLFRKNVRDKQDRRMQIRDELVAGSEKVFLVRCWKKFGWFRLADWKVLDRLRIWRRLGWPRVLPFYLLAVLIWGAIVAYLFGNPERFVQPVVDRWHGWLSRFSLPGNAGPVVAMVKASLDTIVNGLAGMAGALTLIGLPGYVVAFFLWAFMRRYALRRDRKLYTRLTGVDPEDLDNWKREEEDERPVELVSER